MLVHPRSPSAVNDSRLLSGRVIRGIAFSAAVLYLVVLSVTAARKKDGPRFVIDPAARKDFGDGKPNELLSASLGFKNIGDEPLQFSLSASCGCTELNPHTGTVPPGGSQTIRLAVRLSEFSGSEKSVVVSVKTNDRHKAASSYTFTAKCPAPFSVAPAYVDFGSVQR